MRRRRPRVPEVTSTCARASGAFPADPAAPPARPSARTPGMSDNVYSISEIVRTSPDGADPAIRNAVSRASKTLRNLDWFEVSEIRGYIGEDGIDHFQVRLKLGFRLQDDATSEERRV